MIVTSVPFALSRVAVPPAGPARERRVSRRRAGYGKGAVNNALIVSLHRADVDDETQRSEATSVSLPRRAMAARLLGAAALGCAVNGAIGVGRASAFGSGIPGYDINEKARNAQRDAIKAELAEQRELARKYKEARAAERAAEEAAEAEAAAAAAAVADGAVAESN